MYRSNLYYILNQDLIGNNKYQILVRLVFFSYLFLRIAVALGLRTNTRKDTWRQVQMRSKVSGSHHTILLNSSNYLFFSFTFFTKFRIFGMILYTVCSQFLCISRILHSVFRFYFA